MSPERALPPMPNMDARDLRLLASMPFLAAASWCLPEASWIGLCRTLTRLGALLGGGDLARSAHVARVARGAALAQTPEACTQARTFNRHLERLQLLRCYRPGGWHPPIVLEGREHVDAALAEGRGAILWVTPMVFSDLVTKLAFARAGYAVSHLSRTIHGFSDTKLGARLLNPIRTTIERRHLAERLVIGRDGLIGAEKPLAALAQRLAGNRMVSITVGDMGRRIGSTPFMSGSIPLATAPPWLALQTRAPLLPVFTVREADGGFLTRVEPPIPAAEAADRDQSIAVMHRSYTARLEPFLRRYPGQYDWSRIEAREEEKAP